MTKQKPNVIYIKKIDKKILQSLHKDFSIHEEVLKFIANKKHRPKIIQHKNYIFFAIQIPLYNKSDQSFVPDIVQFILFKKQLIIINEKTNLPNETAHTGKQSHHFLEKYLLNIYEQCLCLTDDLGDEIDKMEKEVFRAELANKKLVRKIFLLERKVVDVRKIMRNHEVLMERLIHHLPNTTHKNNYIDDIFSLIRNIWIDLESHSEEIAALRSSYESITSFYLNEILKTLTIISIVFMPLTLVASMYGMNFRFLPLSQDPLGFWLICLFLITIAFFTYLIFKRKNWW